MENEIIKGHFQFEKFRSADYAICNFKLYERNEKTIVVVGNIPDVSKDLLYELSGFYTEHKKYGMQFQVNHCQVVMPEDDDMIIKYLSSPQFKGIGKKTAKMIVEALGEDCLNKIREDNSILNSLMFLNDEKKETILENISLDIDEFAQNLEHFSLLGLSYNQINKINFIYGANAIDILSKNPYQLVYDVPGIGFKTANALANQMKDEVEDIKKNEALLVSLVMEKSMNTGSTYISIQEVENYAVKYMDEVSFDLALNAAITNKYLTKVSDDVYHHTQFTSEYYSANYLLNFPVSKLEPVNNDLITHYLNVQQVKLNIEYSELQKVAITNFFTSDFSIITGGPGTGKTTVVKAMVDIFKEIYPNNSITCIAPTGRASKRLKELCEVNATTIHSLLMYNMENNKFTKGEDDPIDFDVLIIDEGSMIDSYLFYNLLKASHKVKKICILGDKDQLPSVAPGQILDDLIASNCFNTTILDNVYRQKEGSDIINLAGKVNKKLELFDEEYNDVRFYNFNQHDALEQIKNIIKLALDKGYTFNDIQVLSPIYRGTLGIDNLNNTLQKEFNKSEPTKKEAKVGMFTFKENDRILQLKNQPDDDVYNGDIGILEEIILPSEAHDNKLRFVINFDGNYVEYTNETFDRITHAYCMSIHKSQGSEYPIVILVLNDQANHFISKKLIYTAITRAKKSLIIIGDKRNFINICQKEDIKRDTRLVSLLTNT